MAPVTSPVNIQILYRLVPWFPGSLVLRSWVHAGSVVLWSGGSLPLSTGIDLAYDPARHANHGL